MTKKAIIVATDQNWGFGKDGRIPWHIPEDFKYFKEVTANSSCVMGRVTYEEILNIPTKTKRTSLLPGRDCYVVSNSPQETPFATKISSIEDVLDLNKKSNIFFLGGERIFESAIKYVDYVYMTNVAGNYNCDRFFLNMKQPKSVQSSFDDNFEYEFGPTFWTATQRVKASVIIWKRKTLNKELE